VIRAAAISLAALALAGGALSGAVWAQSSAAQLDRRIDTLSDQQARGALDQMSRRARLEELSRQEAALNNDLAMRRGELAKLLGALALFRRQPPPALLISPERARDAVRGAILARALTPDLTRRAQALSAQLERVALLRREAAAANEGLLNAQSAEAERSVDIANALRERQALDPAATSLGPLSEGGARGDLRLAWPANGTVTQRFGARLDAGGRSSGLSIAGRRGATVVSPAAATVDFVGPVQGWGLVLILRAGGAYHLVLGGLDQVNVAAGQSVAPGGAVGRLPNGAKSDPQLYMEVRENGAPVDPARWLSGAPLGLR
jgi:septal ring factor EnvC (AmiA/AmiB activator)